MRVTEVPGEDEAAVATDWGTNTARLAEENRMIARIVEYGGSEACLAWLEQNFHLLGPGHERVEELTCCAAEELIKLARTALYEGRFEECEELLSRAEENCPENPELENLRKAMAENKNQGLQRTGRE